MLSRGLLRQQLVPGRSEEQLHTDLHAARSVALRSHAAETGAGDTVVCATPTYPVEDVERLSADIEGAALTEAETAGQGNVLVEVPRCTELGIVAGGIAKHRI